MAQSNEIKLRVLIPYCFICTRKVSDFCDPKTKKSATFVSFKNCNLMKNNSFFLLIIFLNLFIFDSCQRETYEIHKLTGEPLQVELPFMRYPTSIGLLDSNIIILDLASDSYFYHVCSYPDLTYQYSFGRKGNGPGEIVLPTPFQIFEKSIVLLDGAKGNFFRHSLLSEEIMNPQHLEIPMSTDFIILNDTTVIIGDLSGSYRLSLYTPQMNKGLFSIPDEFKKDDPNTGRIWRSYMDYNRSNNKLVLATQFGDVIEIYNLKDSSCIRKIGKGGIPQSASRHIKGYCDIKWWNNDIYALYTSKEELLEDEHLQRIPSGGNIIHVFNELGEKTTVYHLDIFINGFAIDEKKNAIIGVTSNEDYMIYVFNIP